MTILATPRSPSPRRWHIAVIGFSLSLALLAGGTAQRLVDDYLYGPPKGYITSCPAGFEAWCLRAHILLNLPPTIVMLGTGSVLFRAGVPSTTRTVLLYALWLLSLVLWWFALSSLVAHVIPSKAFGSGGPSSRSPRLRASDRHLPPPGSF